MFYHNVNLILCEQFLDCYQITLKEEDRLAAIIQDIDHDVKIVPRSAFAQSPNGQIYENRSFNGIVLSFIVFLTC